MSDHRIEEEEREVESLSRKSSALSSAEYPATTEPLHLIRTLSRRDLERYATLQSVASARAVQRGYEPPSNFNDTEYKNHTRLPSAQDFINDKKDDVNLVDWDGPDDPENPQNWKTSTKWAVTLVSAFQCFVVSFGSSVFSTATTDTAQEFNVSQEVMVLGVALYVLGFAAGPMIFAPLSEAFGRVRPIHVGFFCFAIFQIPVAVAQNLETIFLCRFLAGMCGSAPLAIDPGMFVDIWDAAGRGAATAIYSAAIFIGPAAGPIIGEFTVKNSSLGWRWTAWFTLIMAAVGMVLGLLTLKESMAPLLLQRKAARLRVETRNWALHAKLDEQPVEFSKLAAKYGLKPFKMIIAEPILIIFTIFIAVVYGILYLTFAGFPIAFEIMRGWQSGVSALPFLGVALGTLFANVIIVLDTRTRFVKTVVRNNGVVIPEQRLPLMILGSVSLTVGLFWFAWTSYPSISWVPQVISTFFIGAGIMWVFIPAVIYLTDVYLYEANSALAVNSLVRSALAAGFTMFAIPMFKNLGMQWAMSLLGFLCIALAPFPVILWFYGKKIRSWSKYAYVLEAPPAVAPAH